MATTSASSSSFAIHVKRCRSSSAVMRGIVAVGWGPTSTLWPMRIAWIGLGTMGAPMAGHLLAAGHELHVHNRTRSREEPLASAGAIRAETPAEAALDAE